MNEKEHLQILNQPRTLALNASWQAVGVKTPHPNTRYDWDLIQSYYNQGNSATSCSKKFGYVSSAWFRAIATGKIKIDASRSAKQGIKPGQKGYDLVGSRFGMLQVKRMRIWRGGKRPRWLLGRQWDCLCDCGRMTVARTAELLGNYKKKCGECPRPQGPFNKRWKGYEGLSASYWGAIKTGAKCRGLPFEISMEYAWNLFVAQEKRCVLSGVFLSLDTSKSQKRNRTASLDRIDSAKGYVIGNVQWIHKDLNWMKGRYPQEDFLRWAILVADFQRKKI